MDISSGDWPVCDGCGCNGNSECGCEPLNDDMVCMLDQRGICGCCGKIGTAANKRRWTFNPDQIDIFNNDKPKGLIIFSTPTTSSGRGLMTEEL